MEQEPPRLAMDLRPSQSWNRRRDKDDLQGGELRARLQAEHYGTEARHTIARDVKTSPTPCGQTASSAWLKSWMRSSADSTPSARRTSPSAMPARRRSSGDSIACDVRHGIER